MGKYGEHSRDRATEYRSRRERSSSCDSERYRKESRKRRSSSSSDEQFTTQLEKMRSQSRERRRRAKELLKSMETPEEKRARRLAKKKEKQLRRNRELCWPTDAISYEDSNNPYGDPNLCKPFIWKRKLEKEGRTNIATEELIRDSRRVIEKNMTQLEEIKQNRLMREMIREDIEMAQRERDMQQMSSWIEQEDRFHLEQARERSKIRMKDERPEPIDYFAAYVYYFMEDDNWMPEGYSFAAPQEYCKHLTVKECEHLLKDIEVYEKLQEGKYHYFWKDVTTIVEDRRVLTAASQGTGVDYRKAVSAAVLGDIEKMFTNKTVAQLVDLSEKIHEKMYSLEDGLDISYWETLLNLLSVRIANARLTDLHETLTNKKLASEVKIKQEDEYEKPCSSHMVSLEAGLGAPEMEEKMMEEYRAGNYSPKYIGEADLPKKANVAMTDLPMIQLDAVDMPKLSQTQMAKIEEFEAVAKMGMDRDEVRFSVEETIRQDPSSLSGDRFKARKPRYFNRVHTGFEWNKYNQTHYDLDNPPPKIVQGYKFNIFYPDLLDEVTPKFTVTPCQQDSDFSIIRFSTGPPYEDIAFRIVNREWEVSQRKGYRCIFQSGIFQLWFQFKKYRYRR